MDASRGNWWAQFLRRSPLKETRPGADVFRFFAPPRRRAGFITADVVAGGALTATGLVYYPPMAGAIVRQLFWTDTTTKRVALIRDTNLGWTNGGPVAGAAQRPIYADVPLRGSFDAYVFAPGLGDQAGVGGGNSPASVAIEVHPPNIFVFAHTGDNLNFEAAIWVEEFVDDALLNL